MQLRVHKNTYMCVNGLIIYPKASTVTAHATKEDAPAAARLSFLHNLIWLPPANFDTIPSTAASIANVKNKPVAPFPPKPTTLILYQHRL